MGWGPIQGMDTIPREVAEKYGIPIDELLPNWSVKGAYN